MAGDQIRETNIGPREARRRLTGGAVMLAAGLMIVAGQMLFGWSKWWRVIAVLPFFTGMMGLLQAGTKT